MLNGIVATMFDFFIDAERKSDITAGRGRHSELHAVRASPDRIETRGKRHEFFKDFFFKLSLLNSFDSKPPTEGTTNKNDFAVTTSLGWSF